jgi:hypothetical protein
MRLLNSGVCKSQLLFFTFLAGLFSMFFTNFCLADVGNRTKLGLEPPSVIWGQVLADHAEKIEIVVLHGGTELEAVKAEKWNANDNTFYRVHLPAAFDLFSDSLRPGGIHLDGIKIRVDGVEYRFVGIAPKWDNRKILRLDLLADETISSPQSSLIDTNVWISEAATGDEKAAVYLRALLRPESGLASYDLSWKRVLSAKIEEITTGSVSVTGTEYSFTNTKFSGQDEDSMVFAGHWLISSLPVKTDRSSASVSRKHYYGLVLSNLFWSYGGAPADVSFTSPGTLPVHSEINGTGITGNFAVSKSNFAPSPVSDGDVLTISMASNSDATTCAASFDVMDSALSVDVFAEEIVSLSGYMSEEVWTSLRDKSEITIDVSHNEVDGSLSTTFGIPFTSLTVTPVEINGKQGYWWKGFSYLDIAKGLENGKLGKISLVIEGSKPADGSVITVEEIFIGEPRQEVTSF